MRDRNAPLNAEAVETLCWNKMGGLLPAIVQHNRTLQVLMLGYMDRAALKQTLSSKWVTFYSRSRKALWQKGESSGNRLKLDRVETDCDGDALLILAEPEGPTCHLGTQSCFSAECPPGLTWLARLSEIVAERGRSGGSESYTARLLAEGRSRIAQKIGEEGVELALAGAAGETDACVEEAADLLYHLALLMEARGFDWDDVCTRLRDRHSDG